MNKNILYIEYDMACWRNWQTQKFQKLSVLTTFPVQVRDTPPILFLLRVIPDLNPTGHGKSLLIFILILYKMREIGGTGIHFRLKI